MSTRDRLRREFEAAGFAHVTCDWSPISTGSEMSGPSGGWIIWSGNHVAAESYNAAGLLKLLSTKEPFTDPTDGSYAVINWEVLGYA